MQGGWVARFKRSEATAHYNALKRAPGQADIKSKRKALLIRWAAGEWEKLEKQKVHTARTSGIDAEIKQLFPLPRVINEEGGMHSTPANGQIPILSGCASRFGTFMVMHQRHDRDYGGALHPQGETARTVQGHIYRGAQ